MKKELGIDDLYRINMFPVNLFKTKIKNHKEYNKVLIKSIKEIQKNRKSMNQSNYGGYHSPRDLQRDDRFNELKHAIMETINDRIIPTYYKPYYDMRMLVSIDDFESLWFTVNKKGDYNAKHTHPMSWLSGAYYVQVPTKKSKIIFHDPLDVRKHEYLRDIQIPYDVSGGELLIFPGWFEHSVAPNNSKLDRISISFNIGRPDFVRKKV